MVVFRSQNQSINQSQHIFLFIFFSSDFLNKSFYFLCYREIMTIILVNFSGPILSKSSVMIPTNRLEFKIQTKRNCFNDKVCVIDKKFLVQFITFYPFNQFNFTLTLE